MRSNCLVPEWVLESGLDSDTLVSGLGRARETHQNLDLANGSAQELESRVVDSLVSCNDGGVGAGDK